MIDRQRLHSQRTLLQLPKSSRSCRNSMVSPTAYEMMQLQPKRQKVHGCATDCYNVLTAIRGQEVSYSSHQHDTRNRISGLQPSTMDQHVHSRCRLLSSISGSPSASHQDSPDLYDFWCHEAQQRGYAAFDFGALLKVSSMIQETEWTPSSNADIWSSTPPIHPRCVSQGQKARYASLGAFVNKTERNTVKGKTASRMLVMFTKHEVDILENQLQKNGGRSRMATPSHANCRSKAKRLITSGIGKDVGKYLKGGKNYSLLVRKAGPGFLLLLGTNYGP